MKHILSLAFGGALSILLAGCEGKTETVGALPDIQVSGSVLGGALQNAEVLLVGINANGQPEQIGQAGSSDYSGVKMYTDANGDFSGYINGAYSGPLLIVARASTDETRQTRMTCSLQAGCIDSDEAAVAYGETYVVPSDFEIWGLDVSIAKGERVDVSWLTHMAAKLAFTSYVSDGTGCDQSACTGATPVQGLITSQSTFKSNDQVKNLFTFSDLLVDINPWHPLINSSINSETTDSIQLAQQVRHGLYSLLLEKVAKDNAETLSEALARLEAEFLQHKGQFYQATANPADLSFKSLVTWAHDEGVAINSAGRGNSGVTQVVGELLSQLSSSFTQDALTVAAGADYISNLADQISAARTFIQEGQVWIEDLGNQQYASYMGDDVAAHMARFDGLWQTFKPTMTNGLEALYKLQMDFVEYAMTCVRGGLTSNNCDTSHVMHAGASFVPATSTLTYVSGANQLTAKIEQVAESTEYFYRVSFTQDLVIDDVGYRVTSTNNDANARAFVQVGLNKPLSVGESPYIVAMGIYYPDILVRAKDQTTGDLITSVKFVAENVVYEAVGTKDVTDSNSPVHYNLLAVNLEGDLKDADDDYVELTFVVNTNASSASLYYPEAKYPELDIRVDINAFQQFARLELDGDQVLQDLNAEKSTLAGWLISRSDIPANELLPAAVTYTNTTSASALDDALTEKLNLPDGLQDFEFGGLEYPGGETKLIVWRDTASTDTRKRVSQCVQSKGLWSCTGAVYLEFLGCNTDSILGSSEVSLLEAMNFLRDDNCLPQVVIEGRGYYNIQYKDNADALIPFTEGQAYDVVLEDLLRLQVETSRFQLLTRFYDQESNLLPITSVSILAQALIDDGNPFLTISGALTAGYKGTGGQDTNGLDLLIPFGDRNLWFALGKGMAADVDAEALAYYLQNGSVTLSVKGLDDSSVSDGNLGVIRYAGSLLGSVRREGNLYVIRYIDDTWQLL